jgi:hypothetical protein
MSYNKQAQAKYKRANKEKLRQGQRDHYERNPEQYALKRKAYRKERKAIDAAYWQANKNTPEFKYAKTKSSATAREIPFRLTLEEFLTLWQKDCTYCGDPIATIGLDRIDSNSDYSIANVVPCCLTCNRAKSELTREEFINHCRKVLKNVDRVGIEPTHPYR